jgi:hypothetical protein
MIASKEDKEIKIIHRVFTAPWIENWCQKIIHSQYYKYFAKHARDFSFILLEPCNFLYVFRNSWSPFDFGYKNICCEDVRSWRTKYTSVRVVFAEPSI